ncbi:hypothetical protein ACIA3K_22055 [Micromonospora sp. NPDC051543]|uniref:hypothetical protein n=1 Tax=Micromonospora sp. NPDC051543 TaxID=3364287 RepID=UPI00378EA067
MTALDDEQLGRLLGDRLHEETYTMTAPSNLTETLHQRNRRRTRALGLAVATPVVAAVAVGASLAFAPGGGAPKEAPEMLTVGYVAEQTANALGQLPGYVQHETAKHQGRDGKQASLIELWADRATSRERQDNKIYYGDVRSYTLALDGSTAVELNHDKKKWWTYQIASLKPVDSGQIQHLPPALNPKDLKRAVDSGKVTLVGKERLDGRQTVHLQWLGGPDSAMDAAKTAEESMQIWVDAKSYQPVRVVNKLFSGTTTSDYEWLPRTKENLAKVTVWPPADYRKLPCTPTPAKDCGLNN